MKQYLLACIEYAALYGKQQRLGQILFNVLYQLYPELADNIRGTQYDPYYINSPNTEVVKRFFKYLENHGIK